MMKTDCTKEEWNAILAKLLPQDNTELVKEVYRDQMSMREYLLELFWDDLLEDMELRGMHSDEMYQESKKRFKQLGSGLISPYVMVERANYEAMKTRIANLEAELRTYQNEVSDGK